MRKKANFQNEDELGGMARSRGWRKLKPPCFVYDVNMPRHKKKKKKNFQS